MINFIKIQNFRGLSDFHVEGLARVNLITGKNNTCKSTLLEAIYLHAWGFDISEVAKIITNKRQWNNEIEGPRSSQNVFNNYQHIFSGDPLSATKKSIRVESDNYKSEFKFGISHHLNGIVDLESSNAYKSPFSIEEINNLSDSNLVLIITQNHSRQLWKLRDISSVLAGERLNKTPFITVLFVDTEQTSLLSIAELWDNIVTTDSENDIIKSLKIIEPKITRCAFVRDTTGSFTTTASDRKAVVRLEGYSRQVELNSMGDGLNRILSIMLAFVNAKDGICLIDEIENGLHYSVQKDLWKIIFKLAHELNVQVFATTHSADCVRAFSEVAYSNEHKDDGALIKMQQGKTKIIANTILESPLKNLIDNDIEVR